MRWTPVEGAVNYVVFFENGGSAVAATPTCNVESGTVRISAVDAGGRVSLPSPEK